MNKYTQMTDAELHRLAYDMTGSAQQAADAAIELRRRARRDAAIDQACVTELRKWLPEEER